MKLRSNIAGFLIGSMILAPAIHAGINLSSSGGISVGGPVTGGTANRIHYTNGAGQFADSASLTFDDSGAGNGVFSFKKTITGASATSNFFNFTGTFSAAAFSADTYASRMQLTLPGTITGAGPAAAFGVTLNGNSATGPSGGIVGIRVLNTNATWTSYGVSATLKPEAANAANFVAIAGTVFNQPFAVNGTSIGVQGSNNNFQANVAHDSAGVIGSTSIHGATTGSRYGGFFYLADAPTVADPPSIASTIWGATGSQAALGASNNTEAKNILELYDNVTPVFVVGDGGVVTSGNLTTAGNAITIISPTMTGASITSNFLNINGTFPVTLSAVTTGSIRTYTSGGGTGQAQRGEEINLAGPSAAYGNNMTALYVTNSTLGTNLAGDPITNSASWVGNTAVAANATANANGSQIGLRSFVSTTGGAARGWAIIGQNNMGSGAINIGVVGLSTGNASATNIAGAFMFGTGVASPTWENAALLADNGAKALPIFVARDNGAAVVTIPDGGGLQFAAGTEPTCDAAHAGLIIFVAGTPDTLRVCSKDAGSVYAFRTLI